MARRSAPVQFRPSSIQLDELKRAAEAAGVSVNELAKRRACVPDSQGDVAPTAIYGLVDPRSGAVRYVGRTRDFEGRMTAHFHPCGYEAEVNARAKWIIELMALNLRPIPVILERCQNEVAAARESFWITAHAGPELLNKHLPKPSAAPGSGPAARGELHVELDVDPLTGLPA